MSLAFCLPPFLPRASSSTRLARCPRFSNSPHLSLTCSLPPDFPSRTSGEWTGYESQFNLQGAPLPIPDYYVPEEFLEWNQTPYGFEVVHSIHVRPPHLHVKHLRVLPSVSVFGDHVDLEDSLHTYDMSLSHNIPFQDGSFSVGPSPVVVKKESLLEKWPWAKMALRNDNNGIQVAVKFDLHQVKFVQQIDMCVEKWTSEWSDGNNLEGGSGFVQGWAEEECMKPSMLEGTWETHDGQKLDRETIHVQDGKRVFLPRGVDVSIDKLHDHVQVTVGWLYHQDARMTLTRVYDQQGNVINVLQSTEHRL